MRRPVPEITILSGKGGTGKTSLTGAFASLAENHVICDLDVDAPDLHLILEPEIIERHDFRAGHLPVPIPDKCTGCGECEARCRYQAVTLEESGPVINETACEGCKVCVHFCPAEALAWEDRLCGHWYLSRSRFGPMVHAQLFPGGENSGLLVSHLREQARKLAEESNRSLILSDGPPGIGCPVISSLSGTDLAVIVSEPTVSGRHDLERVVDLAGHFRVKVAAIINKWDLHPGQADDLAAWCEGRGIDVLGRLPFDPLFNRAVMEGRVVTEYNDGELADLVGRIFARVIETAAERRAA